MRTGYVGKVNGFYYPDYRVLKTWRPATHDYVTASGAIVTETAVTAASGGYFVSIHQVIEINQEDQMYHEANLVGLDFETYGSRPLPTCGLENYVRDPHFTPLIFRAARRSGQLMVRGSFVEENRDEVTARLADAIGNSFIVAHNAPFEKRVLASIGLYYPSDRFVDSAVVARAAGAAGKLEAAAPQLLGVDKMEEGKSLIGLFSIPGKYQEKHDTLDFHDEVIADHLDEWKMFGEYCEVDAFCGLDLVLNWGWVLTKPEHGYNAITIDMNEQGWHVDTKLVAEMSRRYEANVEQAMADFHRTFPGDELNFNSLKQMKEFCSKRGIKAVSFDEKHVERLLARIETKLETMASDDPKRAGYADVRYMLKTKQILGGSSLKKLAVITANTSEDDRLHDQYLHIGAGQTWRTTGKNVQMQNLKRFGSEPANMDELMTDTDVDWSNEELAENLRQVFTATDPLGELLVGDFSSVEGRGLAYLAGETWKVDAFRSGKDLYKVLATKIFSGITYDTVLKPQRQLGKVGELSCGYNAGGPAVQAFASKMGTELSEAEAAKLVTDWRVANPAIVQFWWDLDEMLHDVVEGKHPRAVKHLPYDDLVLVIEDRAAPDSLRKQAGNGLKSLEITLQQRGEVVLRRFFHGVHARGRNIGYFKPTEIKSGDLWKNWYQNPKTKQREWYSIYGGKLAGILTQSFCREIFFRVLVNVQEWVDTYSNVHVVGQFHDEIVVDWAPTPGQMNLDWSMRRFEELMSNARSIGFPSFPLAAEVKHDYRYTK